MHKVLIDTDPGVDDATAILLMLQAHQQKKLEVVGITTVVGNTNIDNANVNALKLLMLANLLTIPVFSGTSQQILRPFVDPDPIPWAGYDGFSDVGDMIPTPPLSTLSDEPAAVALLRQAKSKSPEDQLHLLALGPLTNVALAMTMDPQFTSYLDSFYVMGGRIDGGNAIDFDPEYNFKVDPEAAFIVLNKTTIPIKMSPHDMGKCLNMTAEERFAMGQVDTPVANFLNAIEKPVVDRFKEYVTYDQQTALWIIDDLSRKAESEPFVTKTELLCANVSYADDETRAKMLFSEDPSCFHNIEVMTEVRSEFFQDALRNLYEYTF